MNTDDLFCLQEHPSLTKAERKRICGLMNVKKLTMDASMDAAQNELLPLRVVVQVLFFEQVRSAVRAANNHPSDASLSTTNLEEECDKTALAEEENCKPLGKHMSEIKVTEEFQKNGKLGKKNSKNSRSGVQLLPSRSRRIFDKLWSVGKGQHVENRSSETSGSSQSPTSIVPGDAKSVSSSRHRRHSIS